MNNQEELMKVLVDLLKSTVDLTKEQAPIIFQELLTYGLYLNIITLGIIFIFILFFSLITYLMRKEEAVGITFVITVVLIVTSIMPLSNIVKIKSAPRVYVMDQLLHR